MLIDISDSATCHGLKNCPRGWHKPRTADNCQGVKAKDPKGPERSFDHGASPSRWRERNARASDASGVG
jgi:hypothetical protein